MSSQMIPIFATAQLGAIVKAKSGRTHCCRPAKHYFDLATFQCRSIVSKAVRCCRDILCFSLIMSLNSVLPCLATIYNHTNAFCLLIYRNRKIEIQSQSVWLVCQTQSGDQLKGIRFVRRSISANECKCLQIRTPARPSVGIS